MRDSNWRRYTLKLLEAYLPISTLEELDDDELESMLARYSERIVEHVSGSINKKEMPEYSKEIYMEAIKTGRRPAEIAKSVKLKEEVTHDVEENRKIVARLKARV